VGRRGLDPVLDRPAEDLLAIFMTQLIPSGTFDFRSQVKSLVYSALAD
jgi:hypothetical protein